MNKEEREQRNQKILEDIKNGMSIYRAARKYNLAYSTIQQILKKYGTQSNYKSGRNGVAIKEWRKLSKNRHMPGRIISLPSHYLKQIGINPDANLIGRWYVDGNRIILEVREEHKTEQTD